MGHFDIIIIGAGIAGLSCASRLLQAGLKPLVLDKGRGIGGRLATRRGENRIQFDHGAQFFTARSDAFQQVLKEARKSGFVDIWDTGERECFVGTPGMNGLAKHIGQGLDIRQNLEVKSVRQTKDGFELQTGGTVVSCEKLVATIPAPQAARLFADHADLVGPLRKVELQPCLTLMAMVQEKATAPFISRRDNKDDLAWIALDSSKPARATQNCWVAHASADWSHKHLELSKPEIAEKMLPMLCERIGVDIKEVVNSQAHRWRYAAVSKPLCQPFMRNPSATLYLGGDWCLDARVEAAWLSGQAIAEDVLESR